MTRSRYDDELGTTPRPRLRRRLLAALPATGGAWRRRRWRPHLPRLTRRRGSDAGGPRWRPLPSRPFERRSLTLLVVYGLVVLVTAGQLVRIQVFDAADYAARGADQRERFLSLPADRGRIYDRGGEVLAASVAGVAVVADPSAFRPSAGPDGRRLPAAQPLAPALDALTSVLDVDRGFLRDRLAADGDFVFLARQLDPAVGEEVLALGLEGISLRSEPRRVYPGGSIGAQVIGITDIDGAGLAGMELQHDTLLTGTPGWLDYERSSDGRVIAVGTREVQAPMPGTDLVLTIDRQLQYTAERVAAEAVETWDAAGAAVVVMEVGTGDVLAMASAPLTDLSDRSAVDERGLRNRAVTDVFEPGSVQKGITAAAAIEAGAITPDTVLTVPASIQINGETFSDSHWHPTEELTFAEVLEQSSNVGTIMAAQRLGEEGLADWLARFGYGRRTTIGFPGEASGIVRPVEEWWSSSLPTISIGQGLAVTLMQQATAYATLANDGVAVQPRLVRGTVDDDGVLHPAPDVEGRRVVSVETARQVREILVGVINGDRGTGTRAALDGHQVAGKTGTARKARADGRGYSDTYVANFSGMAPAEDPQLVVSVMVDEPSTIWGGVVAAPAFAEVMAEALRRQQVPPAASGPALTSVLGDAERARASSQTRAAARRATEAARRAGALAGGGAASTTTP